MDLNPTVDGPTPIQPPLAVVHGYCPIDPTGFPGADFGRPKEQYLERHPAEPLLSPS